MDKQNRFLLFLEKGNVWDLPGGGLGFGENPSDCLVRELWEEAGLEVTSVAERPSYFVTGQNGNGQWRANVIYETEVKSLVFKPSEECIDLKPFTKEEALEKNLYPPVKQFLEKFHPDFHR